MRFKNIRELCSFLGPMYSIRRIDGGDCIYRRISDSMDFEIIGPLKGGTWAVNLWQRPPHLELMAIYSGISTDEDLSDTLGYLAFKYQNLQEKIRVEREDPIQ